jgi:hypothetical protein
MKLKKLLIGIVFLAALTCGYSAEDVLHPAVATVQEIFSSSYSVVCSEEERPSKTSPSFLEESKPSIEIVNFALRIDNRFVSSPPRASP